jgi:hypothetical protein
MAPGLFYRILLASCQPSSFEALLGLRPRSRGVYNPAHCRLSAGRNSEQRYETLGVDVFDEDIQVSFHKIVDVILLKTGSLS